MKASEATAPAVASTAPADGLQISRAVRAGIHQLLARQEHLNKINVFPVPDGDTGTNLALTMHAVHGALLRHPDAHAGRTLNRIADAALDGARGNSGAILAQFFLGVADHAGQLAQLGAADLADAMASGAAYARDSMTEPREGTILTVLTDFATELGRLVSNHGITSIPVLLRRGGELAHRSLEHTRDQLESLRKANVVDAGAQGFVELLDGLTRYVESGSTAEPVAADIGVSGDELEITAGQEEDLTHRFCTECVITGTEIDRRRLRERLAAIGSSLVVAGSQTKAKVHVHVNEPAEVFRIAGEYGVLTGEKADDMQRQQHSAHITGRRVAIVTDSAADIPESELERLDIHMVPVRVHFGEQSYLDKVGIAPEEFFERLATSPVHPKTSQPPPGDFRRHFEFLGSHYPEVLSINLTSRASGTCNAARVAADRTQSHGKVAVIDSLNASLGQGLLVIDAAECAAQ
ncbi:MAG TPA: DegV family protein, partial [Steroidobacteraceae bacterium]|nr:DegV family protein [Steroidobacteraceae bacterium]